MKKNLGLLFLSLLALVITVAHGFVTSNNSDKSILLDYNTANADAIGGGSSGEGGGTGSEGAGSGGSGAGAEGCGGSEGSGSSGK